MWDLENRNWPRIPARTKKADVPEHPQVFRHAGLLFKQGSRHRQVPFLSVFRRLQLISLSHSDSSITLIIPDLNAECKGTSNHPSPFFKQGQGHLSWDILISCDAAGLSGNTQASRLEYDAARAL